eukprot:jgi/Pico_ML_1/51552/g2558.t1
MYNGWKRKHKVKYQGVVLPNFLIGDWFGPKPGRANDAGMMGDSRLIPRLQAMQERVGRKVQLYGDAAYPECDVLYSAPKGNNISLEAATFAKTMSSYRESVEWVFGKLGEQQQQHPTVLDKSLDMAAAAATPHRSGQVTGHGSSSSNTPPFWTSHWTWQQQQQHPTVLDKSLDMAAAAATPHRSGQVTGHGSSSSNTPPIWTSHWTWQQQQQHPTVLDKSLDMAAAAATPHRSGQVTGHGSSSSNFVVQQL